MVKESDDVTFIIETGAAKLTMVLPLKDTAPVRSTIRVFSSLDYKIITIKIILI